MSLTEADIAALGSIEQNRQVLQEVASIVQSVSRLTKSLEYLILSTGKNDRLADKTFRFLEYLSDKQKAQSVGKLEILLEALDGNIRSDLSRIIDSINRDPTKPWPTLEEHGGEGNILELVGEFRRKVLLAMAYRVLLFEKGEQPSAMDLDVAPELLSNSLRTISKNEKHYRSHLVTELSSFQEKLSTFEKDSSLSKSVRFVFQSARNALDKKIDAIESGDKVDVLLERLKELDQMHQRALALEEAPNSSDESSSEKTDETQQAKKEVGFFNTLNTWLSSPSDVSWEDAKKTQGSSKK